MKKILFFLLVLISINGLSQDFPMTQGMATGNTRLIVNGGLHTIKGLINGNYADTTAANAGYIDFHHGAQIWTTSDKNFWLRDSVLNMWIRIAKFSEVGGTDTHLGNTNLTSTGTRIFDMNGNSLTFTQGTGIGTYLVQNTVTSGNRRVQVDPFASLIQATTTTLTSEVSTGSGLASIITTELDASPLTGSILVGESVTDIKGNSFNNGTSQNTNHTIRIRYNEIQFRSKIENTDNILNITFDGVIPTGDSDDSVFVRSGGLGGALKLVAQSDLSGGGGITQEQSEDFTGAMFATDNGDIDFTYNDGTPDIGAQIKSGVIVNADINASAAIDISKLNITGTPDGTKFLRDDGSWQTASGGGWGTTGTVATLTGASILQMATNSFVVRSTAYTGNGLLKLNNNGEFGIGAMTSGNSTQIIGDDATQQLTLLANNGISLFGPLTGFSQATTDINLTLQGVGSQSGDFISVLNSGAQEIFELQADGDLNVGTNLFKIDATNTRIDFLSDGTAGSSDLPFIIGPINAVPFQLSTATLGIVKSGGASTYIVTRQGDSGPEAYFGSESGQGLFGMFTNHALYLRTNNVNRGAITAAGDFAFGAVAASRRVHITEDNTTNNAVTYVERLTHITSLTPGTGIGIGKEWEVETSAGNNEIGMVEDIVTTDATAASEDFDYVIKLMAGGSAAAERFRVISTGQLKASEYGGGTFTGTATKFLAVDVDGNIIEENAPGGSGEANTASNLGGGLANWDSKSGVDLRFNTFASADFDLASNLITIDATKWLTITAGNAAYQAADADLTTWAGITPASGVGTFLATPSSANLRSAVTDENGTGALLFAGATSPDFTTSVTVGGVAVPTISSTNTFTNKRITKRLGTVASSATPTINTDNVDIFTITAQTVDITSFTTNLSGTPTDGQFLWIAITGTASRAITWGATFEASTVALPTTTVGTARLDVGFVWNAATSKWRCVAAQ